MPFTFSHPAVVLPLTSKKLRLSATGLIVGSMAPDFEYFLRMTDRSRYSHTLVGVVWFDLPVAIVVCFLYHHVVRDSLFDNLPAFLKERFARFQALHWNDYFQKNWMIVCVSILIGVATHLLWDGFTHETKFFVQRQPELSSMMRVGRVNLASYRFLQLASTIFGGLVVVGTILSLKRHPAKSGTINWKYWIIIGITVFFVMGIRFLGGLSIHDYRPVVVSMISGFIIGLILAPIILNEPVVDENQTPHSGA